MTINIATLDIFARLDGGVEIIMAIDRLSNTPKDKEGLVELKDSMIQIHKWSTRYPREQAEEIQRMAAESAKATFQKFEEQQKQSAE